LGGREVWVSPGLLRFEMLGDKDRSSAWHRQPLGRCEHGSPLTIRGPERSPGHPSQLSGRECCHPACSRRRPGTATQHQGEKRLECAYHSVATTQETSWKTRQASRVPTRARSWGSLL
ncbi:mCG146154, partial [Mus musculus]